MDVLDVPVYVQLHTKTTSFFLGAVSDLKDLTCFFTRYFSPPCHRQAVMLISSLEHHHVALLATFVPKTSQPALKVTRFLASTPQRQVSLAHPHGNQMLL